MATPTGAPSWRKRGGGGRGDTEGLGGDAADAGVGDSAEHQANADPREQQGSDERAVAERRGDLSADPGKAKGL